MRSALITGFVICGLLYVSPLLVLAKFSTQSPAHSAQTQSLSSPITLLSEHEINTQPWPSYQKIQQMLTTPNIEQQPNYLLLILQKAKIEDMLYFHEALEQTVLDAKPLLTTLTPLEVVSSFNYLSGLIARRHSNYEESVSYLQLAMEQAKSINNLAIFILAKQELAYTRSLTEAFESSLTDIQEAYLKAFSINDPLLIAIINETYGAIYGYMEDYKKSIEYYDKALATYKRLKYPSYIAEAIYGLASSYRYWKKYDIALKYFKMYQQLIAYTPNSDISFYSAYGLSMTLAEKGDCQLALVEIDHALTLNGPIDYNAELYKRKADCLINLKQLNQAQKAINHAKHIFEQLDNLDGTAWQLEVTLLQAKLANARGQYQQGYQLLDNYYRQYLQLVEKKSSKRLFKIRSRLEMERRDVEIALLKQKAKTQSIYINERLQHIKEQRYIIILISVLIIVIILFVIVLSKNFKKIKALSIRDPLSNLYNRRYVIQYLNQALENRTSRDSQMAMIAFDIDDFKEINDKHGHIQGDKVIQQIAVLGQKVLRTNDIMSRIGGDEFVCVLPRVSEQQAHNIAKRLLESISEYRFMNDKGDIFSISISVGVAHITHHPISTEQFYNQADKAMYHAKINGKNKACQYVDGQFIMM